MSNNKKYIALPGGKECREVIPNEFEIGDGPLIDGFQKANPTFPLTEVMPEGEFEGEIQHQEIDNLGVFWNISKDSYDLLNDGFRRIAIKPLKAKEPENKCECSKGYEQDECQYHDGNECVRFGVGATVQNQPRVDVVENKETVESLISEYEAAAEKCADFKERACYYGFIEDLKRIKQIPVTVSNNYFDAELIATEYANQYPEKDYHDLQQAVIYGVIAYSKYLASLPTPAVDELNLDERAKKYVKDGYSSLPKNCVLSHEDYLLNEEEAYKIGWKDSTHHNHASFVALVEGEIKWQKEMSAENLGIEHDYCAKKLTDLLNKIK